MSDNYFALLPEELINLIILHIDYIDLSNLSKFTNINLYRLECCRLYPTFKKYSLFNNINWDSLCYELITSTADKDSSILDIFGETKVNDEKLEILKTYFVYPDYEKDKCKLLNFFDGFVNRRQFSMIILCINSGLNKELMDELFIKILNSGLTGLFNLLFTHYEIPKRFFDTDIWKLEVNIRDILYENRKIREGLGESLDKFRKGIYLRSISTIRSNIYLNGILFEDLDKKYLTISKKFIIDSNFKLLYAIESYLVSHIDIRNLTPEDIKIGVQKGYFYD